MNIQYRIVFFSDWHCGSGLAAGADADALVIKDQNGLPYIPGKTMKGLIREAAETLLSLKGQVNKDILSIFGDSNGIKGNSFFSNAEMPDDIKPIIVSQHLSQYLFRTIPFTAIGEDGIALRHSLRKIEVTVPCALLGQIKYIPSHQYGIISDSLRYIKRIGLSRNRGLGRCNISIMED